ncbi:hypothetical protein ACLI09_07110 [Flavobacterium sp. RHBU_24]|uniref:hypothetical protein n=1 Tax=Flavobacterium sp. RHBU_24 TaxID=3391185 RepID=UPI003984E8EE
MRMLFPFALCLFLSSCADSKTKQDNPILQETATLALNEASGLEYANGILWTHEDSGNKDKIYKLDPATGIDEGFKVKGIKNNDWEDITSDKDGSLYIGDFGNNDNDRQNLAIYKIDPNAPGDVQYTINFYYPGQKEFPPGRRERNFDCEAFFEYNGYFYLFSKNRNFESDGTVLVHKLKNQKGYQSATPSGSFKTCESFRKCAIAGADISPDGKTVALVSGSKLWLITNFKGDDFANGTVTSYDLGALTQKEGICFKDNTTLYIADERDKRTGGKLYTLNLADLKANR